MLKYEASRLQVIILILTRQGHGGGILHLLGILSQESLIDLGGGGSKSRGGDELLSCSVSNTIKGSQVSFSKGQTYKSSVADELAGQPEEGLLEVVVGLGRDIVVLEVLLAVEGDGLGLHLALLNVDLVSAEDDRDVLADTDEITVPVGDVLVGDAGGDIEHDDTTLAVDVVSITETTELLLSSGVPHIELNLTVVL